MKKLQYISLGIAIIVSTCAIAQSEKLTLRLNYSVATPMGSFKDAVSNTSFLGFGAEVNYRFSEKFSGGFETGSQDFYQKYGRQVYKSTDGSDISAVMSNSIQTIPLLLKGTYHFMPGKKVQPYIGLAAGGSLVSYQQYLGQFSGDGKTSFAFTARPEAGVYIPFKKDGRAGFNLGAGYNYVPFKYGSLDGLDNLSIKAGISFPLK